MLSVSVEAVGRRKPVCEGLAVPPPPRFAANPVTLHALIDHVVRVEVEGFRTRQADRRLLKALTAREVDAGLAAGKVSAGGSDLDQAVDAEGAVAAAVEAFADGLFLVFVDGDEVKALDATIPLTADSKLSFVRLTMLAGG